MRTEKVWDDFAALPVEAQRQAADFIAFLRQRHQTPKTKKRVKKTALNQEPFVGIWRDRTDMQDSTEWVRRLREKEWTR